MFSNNDQVYILGNKFKLTYKKENNLHKLRLGLIEQAEANITGNALQWHRRLGHLNRKATLKSGLPVTKTECGKCIEGKDTRLPFYEARSQTKNIEDLIHSELGGPISPSTADSHRCYQIKDYIKELKTQHSNKTKNIKVDHGKQFITNSLQNFCREKEITIQYTNSYTPQ